MKRSLRFAVKQKKCTPMLSNRDTVPFPTFIYSDIFSQSTGVQCDTGQSKNYLHLCKYTGAWQKYPVLESQFLLFLPVFTVFTPHCYLMTTIFCTSTEQKSQRCFCYVYVSSQRAGGPGAALCVHILSSPPWPFPSSGIRGQLHSCSYSSPVIQV